MKSINNHGFFIRNIVGITLTGALLATMISACTSAKAADGGEKVVYQQGFEDGLDSWRGRGGGESVTLAQGKSHSGNSSVLIKGRSKTWNGLIRRFVNLKPGKSYRISVWVMYEQGLATQGINISVQQETEGQGETYNTVGADRLPKGDWTYIEGEYTVPKSRYEMALSIYFESTWKSDESVTPDDLFDFYIDDVSVVELPPAPPPLVETDIPTLSDILPEIPLGAAIDYANLNPQDIHHGLLRHFNAYVYGNEMKQDALEPSEGRFVWSKADELVDYAAANGKKVRGHVLVWHEQVPSWMFQGSGVDGLATKEELYRRMERHIKEVVTRYKGKVYAWDVVNEVIGDDGKLRNSKYYQIVGSHEYIANAFKWAHEADPDALLFINDYSIEGAGAKQDGYCKLIKDLLDEGVPISGAGIQAHISVSWPTVGDMQALIRRLSALGVKVQITEMDISIYANSGEARKNADREVLLDQANKYRALFTMFREEARAGNLDMVMLWGLADDGSWLNNHPVPGRTDAPLFFGKDLRAKPAYWILVDARRLPVQIKKLDATAVEHAVTDAHDPAWNYVSPREIRDLEGKVYGTFKLMWTADRLYALAQVVDASPEQGDGVSIFIEPKNQAQERRTESALTGEFSRAQAQDDGASGYTLLTSLPIEAKLGAKLGFDLRIKDGDDLHSWNDFGNEQDSSSINYSTVTLRALPPVTAARRGTIAVDGKVDEAWGSVAPVAMKVKTDGSTPDGSQFRVLWDDEYLYVLVEVVDGLLNDQASAVHEQDSVEIFMDQNNGKTTSYEADDGQYRVNFKNAPSFNGGDSERFKSSAVVSTGGYLVEAAIPLYAVKPAPGTLLGFDVQINDADASGARTGIRNWVSASNMGYQDTSGFGVLILEK